LKVALYFENLDCLGTQVNERANRRAFQLVEITMNTIPEKRYYSSIAPWR
jgi:hypothetical protein